MESYQELEKVFLKTIVIFRPGAIGDTLLDTPLIRSLNEHYPESKIIYISREPAIQILRYNERVSETNFSLREILKIRKLSPEVFIDLKGNAVSVISARLTGAKYRLGIYKKKRAKFYNVHVFPPFGKIHYTVYHRLEFLRPFGIDPMKQSIDLEFPFPEHFVEDMERKLKSIGISGFFMVSHIRFDLPHRRWEPEKFCEFFRLLHKKCSFPMLLVNDGRPTPELQNLLDCGDVKLAPQTRNLFELGALMRLAGVFFGSDSGPKHIAISQGTPTFSLFFTELPEAWTPPGEKHAYAWKGLPCQPCWKKKCPLGTFDCIHKLGAREVFVKFKEFLSKLK